MTTTDPITSEDYVASLLQIAIAYAMEGLPVFPLHGPLKVGLCDCRAAEHCTSPAKHPRTPNGFKDASTNELDIRRWWREWPRANIGIAVPPGYVVLDIDGPEGMAAVMEHSEGELYEDTPRASTGKGTHIWFRTPSDMPPRAKMLPQVDLRGPGSYVVAPPSLHILGRQYLWEREPWDRQYQEAPAWLIELATKSAGAGADPLSKINVAGVLAGVPEGRRDQELFRTASKLRYADVPYEIALALIIEAAASCTPPLPAEVATAKVDSAYGRYTPGRDLAAGEGRATLLSEDSVQIVLSSANGPVEFLFTEMEKISRALECELSVRMLAPGTSEDSYDQHLDIMSYSARDSCRREMNGIYTFDSGVLAKLVNKAFSEAKHTFMSVDRTERLCDIPAPDEISYIVDEIVLEERPTILFGAGSASKTWILMSMMLAISRGEPWIGHPTQQRNCLLIDYETGKSTASLRLNRLSQALGLPGIPSNILIWPARGVPLYDQKQAIMDTIKKHNIGFIGIDHAGAACGTEPERAESALKFYRTLSYWARPVVCIAHITGNNETAPEQVKRPFGSVYWANGAGMTWFVQRGTQEEGSDVVDVGCFSKKFNDSGKPRDFGLTIVYDGKTGPISIEEALLRNSPELSAIRGSAYVIDQMLLRPMTIAEIADATGISLDTTKKTMLRHNKMFVRQDNGSGQPSTWRRRIYEDKSANEVSPKVSPAVPSPTNEVLPPEDLPF